MSLKLKVLGLGLLALVATSAFTVLNASATVNGHFTNDALNGHATIIGTEEFHKAHSLSFQRTEPTGTFTGAAIVCTKASYHGTVSAATVDSITVKPTYEECATTTSSKWGEVEITTNGCEYTFRSTSAASTHEPTHHATVSVICPVGKAIEIHHPNCTTTVPAQTFTGVTYTTITENTNHAITLNVTVTHIKGEFHGGICIFLGTNKEFDMNGAVTVKGTDTDGKQVNITAT